MQLAKVIYDIEDNKDSLVFYSLSILILMISIFQTKNMSEFLHPKKLISLIQETATTSEVMETTQYESVIPVFTELLTTIRQKVTMSRVANILAVYNWAGNIVCISDVILPPLDVIELFTTLKTSNDI
ncbi:uncharacterized protein LOC112681862 [Sipha flava]|uniref:Uncharacterized protein LOC112681862 n=1 Tax=Sipha flava TaxID=143950 RepID=A0A8B8FC13_9HEMI|nr:uncharacterized protein LOC112681862 [Sipha flava]